MPLGRRHKNLKTKHKQLGPSEQPSQGHSTCARVGQKRRANLDGKEYRRGRRDKKAPDKNKLKVLQFQ